jgi:RNA binding exosome subunit
LKKLEELYRNGVNPNKREEVSAAITGKSNISNFLKNLLDQAKKEENNLL